MVQINITAPVGKVIAQTIFIFLAVICLERWLSFYMHLAFATCVTGACIYIVFERKPKRMPPGPWEFPFLGQCQVITEKAAMKLKERYGNIVTVRHCFTRTVLVFDYRTASAIQKQDTSAGRPASFRVHLLDDKRAGGVLFSQGKQWLHERHFVLTNLRNHGMGKTRLGKAIMTEVKAFVNDLKSYGGSAINVPDTCRTAPLNIIWQLVAGKRYDLHSTEVMRIYGATSEIHDQSPRFLYLGMYWPFLRKIRIKCLRNYLLKEHLVLAFLKNIREVIGDTISEHEARLNRQHPKDLIDEYLIAMEKDVGNNDTQFRKGSLLQCIADLFSAGSDTMCQMLKWVIFLLARYPEIAATLSRQIDQNVPHNSFVSLKDKPKLVYLNAFINELLRYSSLMPINMHHTFMSEMKVGDYKIPKDTILQVVNYSINFDPQHWNDPEEFRPERFIDDNGRLKSPTVGFVPFSIGRRSCIGESLARMELYLFTGAIAQNFEIKPARDYTLTDEFPIRLSFRVPKLGKLHFIPRAIRADYTGPAVDTDSDSD